MANTSSGKEFEEDWKSSYKGTSHFFLRLIDGAKWVQGQGASFTPSNPCDAIQHTMPFLWLLELKSTEGASISFWANTPWQKPKDAGKTQKMIKASQVKALRELGENPSVLSGFVFNYRPRKLKSGLTENRCFFVHIKDFIDFAVRTGKSSISIDDCEQIGVEIISEKKKVHYKYDIATFADNAITYYIRKGYIKAELLHVLKEWLENLLLSVS